jgi:hypothetical protein
MRVTRTLQNAALAALCAFSALPAQALVTVWDGSSNLLPNAVDPNWTLVDTSPGSPSLTGGTLTIQTSGGHSARQFYTMTNTDFSGATPYWVEAEMKFVSGSETSGWWRSGGIIAIKNDGFNAFLGIRKDFIFLLDADNHATATATVDTDDAFHVYKLEVLGDTLNSLVNVYQDGILVLSDTSLYNAGGGSSVGFGEGSTLATGTTLWKSVSHNVAAVAVVPEPETWAMLLAGLGLVGFAARRRHA